MEQISEFYNCFKIKCAFKVVRNFPKVDETTRTTDSKWKENRDGLLSFSLPLLQSVGLQLW